MWKNGALVGVSGITVFGTPGNKTGIGRNVIGSTAAGDEYIAEVLVYNSSLSSTDRGNVQAYLAAKYGL